MLSRVATRVYKHVEQITDPRLNRGLNHDLGETVFIALTAALAGADSWADVERFGVSHQNWFAKHLPLENGIPSHDTRHGQSPLHTITTFACGTRTVLRQMSVPDKSHEIPAVPPLANPEDVQIPICAVNADEALKVIRKHYDQWKQPQV